ncbi:MAG: ATP-binding protein [Candidatus Saccharimonadales bacterium]
MAKADASLPDSTIDLQTTNDGDQKIEIESLLNSIGDGAVMTDEFGRIVRINPAALSILGFESNDLLGKFFPKVMVAVTENGKPVGLIDRPISKAFLTGKSISEKINYRRKDGQAIPVSVTVAPMMIGDRPVGAIEVFRDISLENEIDRMKSEFISLASHQLRTPLSAIKTYSHMLIEGFMGPVEPAQKKALNTIISASNRMNELISTLLNITRIESGSIAITPKYVNINKLAEEVHKELLHTAEDKSITMTVVTPQTAHQVRTDNLIAKEILSNLVTNAIKYTPENGAVHIKVLSRKNDVCIKVTDTGFGIPLYSQDQIFTKFFRAHNVVKRETTGTGLGLYLVKGLVDVLGGKVWFVSKEDEGSSFYFSLPKQKRTSTKKAQLSPSL